MKKKNQEAQKKSKIENYGITGFPLSSLRLLLYIFFFLLSSCSSKPDPQSTSSAKFQQYYFQGEKAYEKHCSNCHQNDGSGLNRLYPPINTSDYLEKNFEEVICLMRYGKSGEIFVNGIQYNHPMRGIGALSDLEIAEIATYIFNSWKNERGIVEVKEAAMILAKCPQEN